MPSLLRRPPQWPDIPAPVAERRQCEIAQLGRLRIDPYAWMKYVPASGTRELETLPEPLRRHLRAEMNYAAQMLRPLEPRARCFYERMMSRAPEVPVLPADAVEGWQYESAVSKMHGHRIFSRRRPGGESQHLLDEGVRAKGHAYYRATGHQASPDDRYFAWAEDIRGDDRHQIHVFDTETGRTHTVAVADAFGYGGFTFSSSSRHVFWIWRDAFSRPTRLYRTSVDGGEAELVFEENDPSLFMQVSRSAANGYVVLTLMGPDISEVHLFAADAETSPARIVRPRERGIRYEINEWNGALLMLTNLGGAQDRQLLSLDPGDFGIREVLVPPRTGVPIVSVHPFERALLRVERERGIPRLVLRTPEGRETTIQFDEPAYSVELAPQQPYRAREVRLVHQSPATPRRWLDVNLDTGARTILGQEALPGFSSDDYVVERLHATAEDGETIPITVLSRRDAAGTAQPLLLTGYGAYGISYEPVFSLPATVLVDAGFRYAIAHVRGGSEKGWHWYQSGCREKKRNSMSDFVACARYLVDRGYARKNEVVSYGVSAGGLLVAGALNLSPTTWAGVIAQVPFVDMLNTMSDADHPLVPLLRPDWGDPLSDPRAYDHMAALSPYENVHPADYPPVLSTAGLKDDRVPYWEPAKWLANIRHHSTSCQPAILHLNPQSGHQESDDMNAEFTQAALFWAFACHCVGAIPESFSVERGERAPT